MQEQTEAIRFCEKEEYLTHTEHLMIVSQRRSILYNIHTGSCGGQKNGQTVF